MHGIGISMGRVIFAPQILLGSSLALLRSSTPLRSAQDDTGGWASLPPSEREGDHGVVEGACGCASRQPCMANAHSLSLAKSRQLPRGGSLRTMHGIGISMGRVIFAPQILLGSRLALLRSSTPLRFAQDDTGGWVQASAKNKFNFF